MTTNRYRYICSYTQSCIFDYPQTVSDQEIENPGLILFVDVQNICARLFRVALC